MARKSKAPKPYKHKATPADITRDPSLRWFPLKKWECVWCDSLGKLLRFVEYRNDGVDMVVAEMDSMRVLEDTVPSNTTWRPRTY